MLKQSAFLATCLFILGIPGSTFADPIRLISFDQFAIADALAYRSSGLVGDSARSIAQDGNNLIASAQATHEGTTTIMRTQLESSISPDLHLLSGTAISSANIFGPSGVGSAQSSIGAIFDLDTPHAYDFSATFRALGFFGSWQAHLSSSPGGGPSQEQLLFTFTSNAGKELDVHQQGILGPGRYGFLLISGAGGDTLRGISSSSSSDIDFALQLAPTPEPGSMLLVAGGAALLARLRRRRIRRSEA